MMNSPCFLIAVMLPSICGHESFLQECCCVFVLSDDVRLGDGYADDKHLSKVSLICSIMRTCWLDIFLLNSWTHHTRCQWYHMIYRFIDSLYCGVSWCIISWIFIILWYRIVKRSLYSGNISVLWQDLCIVTWSLYRERISVSWQDPCIVTWSLYREKISVSWHH